MAEAFVVGGVRTPIGWCGGALAGGTGLVTIHVGVGPGAALAVEAV